MAKSKRAAPSPAMAHTGHDDYMAEDDLRTLINAEKIKKDPKRCKAAMCKKREMAKHLSRIGS